MTAAQFIDRIVKETGKTKFTYSEVIALVIQWQNEKAAAVKSDADIDRLLGIEGDANANGRTAPAAYEVI